MDIAAIVIAYVIYAYVQAVLLFRFKYPVYSHEQFLFVTFFAPIETAALIGQGIMYVHHRLIGR